MGSGARAPCTQEFEKIGAVVLGFIATYLGLLSGRKLVIKRVQGKEDATS